LAGKEGAVQPVRPEETRKRSRRNGGEALYNGEHGLAVWPGKVIWEISDRSGRGRFDAVR
jgi:hypothetical protein